MPDEGWHVTQIIHRRDGVDSILGYIGHREDEPLKYFWKKDLHHKWKRPTKVIKVQKRRLLKNKDGFDSAIYTLIHRQGYSNIYEEKARTIPIPELFKSRWLT